MSLLGILVAAQLAAATRPVSPVLAFPETGLDDTAAYQGYRTRFFRDAAGNTVQIYIDGRSGRVVHLLADAEDESIAFSVRDAHGQPAPLAWNDAMRAGVSRSGRARSLEYALIADAPAVDVGLFLLGSMRVERDFQYWQKHRGALSTPPFVVPELERLQTAIGRLDANEQRRALALLNANDLPTLRSRLTPEVSSRASRSRWTARVVQSSLEARDTLVLEIEANPRDVIAARNGNVVSLRARSGSSISFVVRISTTARPLTPLTREQIFTPDFLGFLAAARKDSTSTRARWLERNTRGVELLASREKLMAGLPAYATYFGRDMLVSALMMHPIWRDEMSELAIASVLRKLSPSGQVSHEEALGGQAVRESAGEYADLIEQFMKAREAGRAADAARLLARSRDVLHDHAKTRENYHMIDNLFQLPVLSARWLSDPNVSASRRRAFLLDSIDGGGGGGTRLARLLRELALVTRLTEPYTAQPVATNLVSFAARDSGRWQSASWRDSDVGYANGRFAMDVNAIWAPHALRSIEQIVETLHTLGLASDSLERARPALRHAIDVWSNAWRHFVVRMSPSEIRSHVDERLAAMTPDERAVWRHVLDATHADRDLLEFLAIALDAGGKPIGVANTDPATGLFLGDDSNTLRDVRLFARDYPVGLFIDGVGPIVANDAYASPSVWTAFERDRYHGPRVVWGREVNLFALGVMNHIAAARAEPSRAAYVRELDSSLVRVLDAAHASGFHSELWSYEIANGRVVPVRYGTGSDVQLWSTTDLAVEYMLARLRIVTR